jgi:hypothetical protein
MWFRAAFVAVSVISWGEAAAQGRSGTVEQMAPIAAMATTNSVVDGRLTPPGMPSNPAEIDTNVYGAPRLYELRLAHIANATVKVYDSGHDILMPLDQFCRTAELLYKVDIPHRIVRLGEWTVHLTSKEFAMASDTPYVSLAALDRVTHATAEIDRDDAAITLSNIESFPVIRRANRTALRSDLLRNADLAVHDTADAFILKPDDAWGGLSMDYSVLGRNTWSTAVQGYSVAASTMFAGGSLETHAEGDGAGIAQGGASWLGAWPVGHTVAQLRVGDGNESGPGSILSRGLFISNAPLVRPSTIAVIPINGTLPADWSIEAYRDGALIAFDSVGPTGRYKLPVPVAYGENPFDLVAYGPSGQTQQLAYVFQALPMILASHTFEYAASTGACVSAACAWSSNADVQYGVTSLLSARGGVTQYAWHDYGSSLHPYLGLTAMPLPGLGMEIDGMRGAYNSAQLRFEPSPVVSIAGDYTTYSNSRAGVANAGGTLRNTFSFYGSMAHGTYRPELEVQALRTVDQFGVQGFERIASAINFNGSTIRPYVRIVQSSQENQSFVGADVMLMPAAWKVPKISQWLARGTLEATPRGAWMETQVTLSRIDTRRLHVEGGVLWQRQLPGPQFTFSLTTDIGAIRSVTTATTTPGNGTALQQSASGSLRWDADMHQMIRSADPVMDRSGISGTVFLDANGNGQLDLGERTLANVRVRIDNTIVTTDENGHYEMLGAIPTELAAVSTDTMSLESPWWTPSFNKTLVRTLPNHVVSANIPVMVTGVVQGQVLTDAGEGAHVPLVLTDLATGKHRTIETFADGGFYQMGISPGKYSVQVDEATLATLHMRVSPVSLVITGGSITRDVQVVIRTN